MQRLLTLLVVAFFSYSAIAFEPQEEPATISTKVPCNSWDGIAYNLYNEYKEVPVAEASASVALRDGPPLAGTVVTFINPDSHTFSIVMKVGDDEQGLACILAAGDKFMPADPSNYLEMLGAIKM